MKARLMRIAVMLGGLVFTGCADESAIKPVIKATPRATMPAQQSARVALDRKPTPEQLAWEAAIPLMIKADEDSLSAARACSSNFKRFFDGRKKGASPFADSVLGLDGKLATAGSVAEGVINSLGEFFGGEKYEGQDRLSRHVEDAFGKHVINQRLIHDAMSSDYAEYVARLRRIENALFVAIKADISQDVLEFKASLPTMPPEMSVAEDFEDVLSTAARVGRSDSVLQLGQYLAADMTGKRIAAAITPEALHPGGKFVVNIAADFAVNQVLNQALSTAGHDPNADIVRVVNAAIDCMADKAINGRADSSMMLKVLHEASNWYPDADVRRHCDQAVSMMLRGAQIGMLNRLDLMGVQRSRVRFAAIHKHIFGSDPIQSYYTSEELNGAPPPSVLIQAAQIIIKQGDVPR